MGKKQGNTGEVISIRMPIEGRMIIKIVGDTSLIMDKFPDAGIQALIGGQTEPDKVKPKKKGRDPEQEFKASIHCLPGTDIPAAPAAWFKGSMINAVRSVDGLTMVEGKMFFAVFGMDTPEYSAIKGELVMRTDVIRMRNGSANVKFRAEFLPGWETNIQVTWNGDIFTKKDIVNLLALAGKYSGVGSMRIGKTGHNFGMFHVEAAAEDIKEAA